MFIDYTKAFDLINRKIIIKKLENITGKTHETRLLQNILASNYIEIDNTISKSDPIEQTNGVLQGDPISPLLFIIATAEITRVIDIEDVKVYAYADDMAFLSHSIDKLQNAFDKLTVWADENDLLLNENKTVKMTFRRGGRLAANDTIIYKNKPLANVTHFRYLGVTLQPKGNIYTLHIKERIAAATIALNGIKNLHRLSLSTAMTLFHLKIKPIITYAMEAIWEHLKKRNLEDIEKIKGAFLKRALCLSKYTLSRLVYVLAKEQFFIEDLRQCMQLPSTVAYNSLLQELEKKRNKIWPEFFTTDAMIYREWTRAEYDLRHVMTRFAVHGFHHQICKIERFHDPDEHIDQCCCKLCGNKCDRYHVFWCSQRKMSLNEFCKD